jgi:K+-sensing histidine kinase KdpD
MKPTTCIASSPFGGRLHEQLANIASHELRNPVHVLSLNVRAARTALDSGASPESVRQHLANAEAQAARVRALLDRMLRSSGFLSGRGEPVPVHFDLSDAVTNVLRSMENRTAATPITSDLMPVLGFWERSRVEQIIEHLVVHAITFGGGHPIRISLRAFPDFVYVSLCDCGLTDDRDAPIQPASSLQPGDPSSADFGLWAASQLSSAMGGSVTSSRSSTNRLRLILTLPIVQALSAAMPA